MFSVLYLSFRKYYPLFLEIRKIKNHPVITEKEEKNSYLDEEEFINEELAKFDKAIAEIDKMYVTNLFFNIYLRKKRKMCLQKNGNIIEKHYL